MPFIALAGWLPQIFWLLLVIVCLIIIAGSVYFLLQNRKFHTLFLQTLSSVTESISELDRCRIENLEPLRDELRSERFPLLSEVGEKLYKDSERLYQGKWIADPAPLLRRDRVLTRSQYRSASGELPIQILSVSVLATSLFLLIGLSGSVNRTLVTQISFLPALFGAVAALLLFFQAHRARQSIDRALNHLSETIVEKVPVFRELAGTAALIESFFRYDRQMADSISLLSDTVDQLTHNELAESLAENVRLVMEKEVSPPLNAAADALHDLAGELTRRQEEGMRELAERFTDELVSSLDDRLRPFYSEIEHLTRDIYEANKQSDIALGTMEEYKQQSIDIQSNLSRVLEDLDRAGESWRQDMADNKKSVEALAETSARLAELQAGSEDNLAHELGLLREKFSEVQDSLYRVTQGLHLENQQASEFVRELSDNAQQTLGDMRQLTAVLIDQTSHIEKQNAVLQSGLKELEDGLNLSVRNFSAQILAGVEQTLDSFDEGLAEVTERLSNTTAEINDTVGAWVSDIRWSEEYRYRNRPDDLKEREEKNQALLDILYSRDRQDDEETGRSEPEDAEDDDDYLRKDGENLD